MAQFFTGNPNSLLRSLGIMHGGIGADNYGVKNVCHITDVTDTIADMMIEGAITSEEESANIHKAAQEAGMLRNIAAVIEEITSLEISDDFSSDWRMQFTYSVEAQKFHGRLLNLELGIDIPRINDFYAAVRICDELFQGGDMNQLEAVAILKCVLETLPMAAADEDANDELAEDTVVEQSLSN